MGASEGRNAISWTKKFELDVYYVDNLSLLFDLKIFSNKEGVYQGRISQRVM